MAHRSRRRRRTRYRRNPSRVVYARSGSGLGSMMPYLLIGGAAYFLLLRPGGLSSIFGGAQPAVAGYTPIGGTYYRNTATGQTVQRLPTGQMVTATGVVAPSGVPNWLQPTVQAGAMAIPQLGIGIVQGLTGALTAGVRSLFGSSVASTTTPDGQTATGSGTVSAAPDVLSGSYLPPLPPLPGDLLVIPDVSLPPTDLGSLPPLPALPDLQMTLTLAPLDTSAWSVDTAPPPDFSAF
jgi:hypothetical protein